MIIIHASVPILGLCVCVTPNHFTDWMFLKNKVSLSSLLSLVKCVHPFLCASAYECISMRESMREREIHGWLKFLLRKKRLR